MTEPHGWACSMAHHPFHFSHVCWGQGWPTPCHWEFGSICSGRDRQEPRCYHWQGDNWWQNEFGLLIWNSMKFRSHRESICTTPDNVPVLQSKQLQQEKGTVDVCHYVYLTWGAAFWSQYEGILFWSDISKNPKVSSLFVGFCCILGGRQHSHKKSIQHPQNISYSESLSFANLSAVWKFVLSSGSWTLPTRRVVTLFMIPLSIGPSTVRRLGVFHRSNPATVCTRW